jgi:hypothetical protein
MMYETYKNEQLQKAAEEEKRLNHERSERWAAARAERQQAEDNSGRQTVRELERQFASPPSRPTSTTL